MAAVPHIHFLHEDGPWPETSAAWCPALSEEYGLRRDGVPLLPTLVVPHEAMPLGGLDALAGHLANLHDFAPLLSPEGRSDRVLLLLEVSWVPRHGNLKPFTLPVIGYHLKNHEALIRGLDFSVYKNRLGSFIESLEVLRRGKGSRWLTPLSPLEDPLTGDALVWKKKLQDAKTPSDWVDAVERSGASKAWVESVLTNNKGQLTAVLDALGRRMAEPGAPVGDVFIRPHLDNHLLTDHIGGAFMSADPWDGTARLQGMVDRGGLIEEEQGLESLPPEIMAQVEKAAHAFRRHDADIQWVEFLVVGSRLWVTGRRTVEGISPRARWRRVAELVTEKKITAEAGRRLLTAVQVESVLSPDFQKPLSRWSLARPLSRGRCIGPVITDLRKVKPHGESHDRPILLCREWSGEVLAHLAGLGGLILFGPPIHDRVLKILQTAGIPAVQVPGTLPEGRIHNLGSARVKTGGLLSLGVEPGGGVWVAAGDGELRSQPLVASEWSVLLGRSVTPGFRLCAHMTDGAEVATATELLAEPWGMIHLPDIMGEEGAPLRHIAQSWLARDDEDFAIRLEADLKDRFTRLLAMGEPGEIHLYLDDGSTLKTPARLNPLLLQPGWYRSQIRAFLEALAVTERPTAGSHLWLPGTAFRHLGASGLGELRGMAEGLQVGLLWQDEEHEQDFIPGVMASDFTAFRGFMVESDSVAWNLARALRPDHRRFALAYRQAPDAMVDQVRRVRAAGADGAFYPLASVPLLRWALAEG